jgi:hypothetical protein
LRLLRFSLSQLFLWGTPVFSVLAVLQVTSVWLVLIPVAPVWWAGAGAVRRRWRSLPIGPLTLEESAALLRVERSRVALDSAVRERDAVFADRRVVRRLFRGH